MLTLGAVATDIRRRGVAAWPDGAGSPAYRDARTSIEALVGLLDATAADPARVGEAVVEVMRAEQPPAKLAVGDGIDDLLALAAQPAEARAAVLADLMATANAMATADAPGAGAAVIG